MEVPLASPALLQKIDELREKNVGQHIPLPQLVVVGDQSSGKSSLLESLTGIPFPRDIGLCTRYATQITSRRDSMARIEIAIVPGPSASDSHRQFVEQYRPALPSTTELEAQFPKIMQEVNRRMGIKGKGSKDDGKAFSEDVLKIEICSPDADYLTIIDVPGIFRIPTKGLTTMEDMAMVKNMVEHYMENPRTIILAVLPSTADITTQEVLLLAEQYDKSGERTLGILTKPDVPKDLSDKQGVCDLVLGKRQNLTLGYHVVRNRGPDDKDEFDHEKAHNELLRDEPWSQLPRDRVGVAPLRARLSELLGDVTRKEFPKLRRGIEGMLKECEAEIESLGPSRCTDHEQRVFLSSMTTHFQKFVDLALTARYSGHSAFEHKRDLRLITHAVNMAEEFSLKFKQKAHLYKFESSSEALEQGNEIGLHKLSFTKVEQSAENSIAIASCGEFDYNQYGVLDPILFLDTTVSEPLDNIMDWMRKLYDQSRSLQLGTFGDNVLSIAFKQQSQKWETLTRNYMSRMVLAVHRFIDTALEIVCPDLRIREEVWSAIIEDLLQRYTLAMNSAHVLLNVERNRTPYVLDLAFNRNLQAARAARKLDEIRSKARIEQPAFGKPAFGVASVDLETIKAAAAEKTSLDQVIEDIHDILCSYYELSQQRFVDNVYIHAVEHSLLTGSEAPLAVFSPEWAIRLSAEQLDRIAGESAAGKARRESLYKKMNALQEAMQILKR